MKFQVYLIVGTSLSCFPALAFGQCVTVQDCAALGYTESSCDGGKGVKCPFGSGWFCAGDEASICVENGFKYSCTGTGYAGGAGYACGGKYTQCTCSSGYAWNGSSCALSCSSSYKYTCTGTGYAGGAGSACGGKYAQCTCASGYEWKDGNCQQTVPNYSACKIGTLFYSDGTCSNDKLSGKELLGVVVYEKTASESGWVMTVKPVVTGIAWDTDAYYSTGVTDKAASASCTNTQELVAKGSSYEAAIAANNYNAGRKQWCLPSYNVLNNINNSTNFAKVNTGIRIAGGTILGNASRGYENVWSSSEYSGSSYVWGFHADTSGSFYMNYLDFIKTNTYSYMSVRPVLAF